MQVTRLKNCNISKAILTTFFVEIANTHCSRCLKQKRH